MGLRAARTSPRCTTWSISKTTLPPRKTGQLAVVDPGRICQADYRSGRAAIRRPSGVSEWRRRPQRVGTRFDRERPVMGRTIPKAVRDSLRSVDLFSACTKAELCVIASLGTGLSVADGVILTQQGAIGREFFFLVGGHARCLVDGHLVRTFGPGDFFGEMALVDREPRCATVIAEGGADLVVLNPAEFNRLLKSSPSIGQKVRKAMDLRRQTTRATRSREVASRTERVTGRTERDTMDLGQAVVRGLAAECSRRSMQIRRPAELETRCRDDGTFRNGIDHKAGPL